jgi:hypothetical protein
LSSGVHWCAWADTVTRVACLQAHPAIRFEQLDVLQGASPQHLAAAARARAYHHRTGGAPRTLREWANAIAPPEQVAPPGAAGASAPPFSKERFMREGGS